MSSNLSFRLAVAVLMAWIPMITPAATAALGKSKDLPKALETLIHRQQFDIVKRFDTDAPGIEGYVVEDKSHKMGIFYTYKDFLISGVLIAPNGQNLSDRYAREYIPKPDYAAGVKALEKTGFMFGEGKKGAPEIYVFADPNCFFCHKLWKATREWVDHGKVRIHWVMVGFLKKSSPGRAAAILAARDGARALAEDERNFDLKNEEGGLAELRPIPGKYKKALKEHASLMAKLRFSGTPGIVFQDVRGQWQGINGMPPMAQLAQSLGIK